MQVGFRGLVRLQLVVPDSDALAVHARHSSLVVALVATVSFQPSDPSSQPPAGFEPLVLVVEP